MSSGDGISFQERQDYEFEMLKSIYNKDIVDLRKNDAWNISRPPKFSLILKPQDGMSGHKETYSQLELQVNFPPKYPNCCPDLKIENSKGLSSEDLEKLETQLKELCEKYVGEVMMLEVAQYIQEFLHNHNVPSYESFYEEMVQNKQKQKEKEAKEFEKMKEIQKRKEKLQRREIEEELARREKEEKQLQKLFKDERENVLNSGSFTDSDAPSEVSDATDGIISIQFNKKTVKSVMRGQLLGFGSNGSGVYVGMVSNSGQIVAVHHWNIPFLTQSSILTLAEKNKFEKFSKTLLTIEQELQSLVKLSHTNLVSYLGIKTTHTEKSIEVYLLQDYVPGISLQQKISNNEKVPLDVLRAYAGQMLTALEYLHSKSVVHKQFKASSVFLDSRSVIKVADYSIGKRLTDLYTESNLQQPGVRFSEDKLPSRIGKKGDILRLGIVLLSLAQGQSVTDYPPEISSNYPPAFYDFLNKCLTIVERERSSATELLDHEFIKVNLSELLAESEDVDAVSNGSNDADDVHRQHGNTSFESQSNSNQLSRLHSEFEELEWLGKGGYGDVVKVRNKLDDRHYAIKRIDLKPSQSEFNKKITREVKLLSRLNHENVVRYYNSWIETMKFYPYEVSTSSSSNLNSTVESKPSRDSSFNSLGLIDNIEKIAPPANHSSTSEWSMSVEEVSRHGVVDDDEDDDDEDMFKTIYLQKEDSSDSVLFDRSSGDESDDDAQTTKTVESTTIASSDTNQSSKNLVIKRYLYIQMEYCEKSTLRDTIDYGLYKEQDRMWRLFREILEGLSHVHNQGMIHRDLKPQNIFLDRNDHVKIGDFGLAISRSKLVSSDIEEASSSPAATDSTHTGAVGTSLYVAPEMESSSRRILYNQKVDIYSLGIIFFEMSYPGSTTKMERVKILGNLRTSAISFPSDFDEAKMEREATITKWCLDHEPSKRPTASDLLKCQWVPTPVLEESDVLEAVREMLSDNHSKQHRLIMDQVFNRPIQQIVSMVYDYEIYKRLFNCDRINQQKTFGLVSSIMERHGAVRVNSPLLLTRLESEGGSEVASFMDSSGTVVTLPYSLRVPFARFLAFNNITDLKRYSIEKVYRARKISGSRPKEIWECTFDIVTPSVPPSVKSLIPDAEVISVVSEIISNFPELASRKYALRVNHMLVLKAILKHCGLEETHHATALTALASSDGLSKSQIDACLSSLPLNMKQMTTLSSLIQIQGPLSKLQTSLKSVTKNKHSSSSSWARAGLHELELIKKNLDYLNVQFPLIFDLGFCVKHHNHYSGVIFQISAEIQKKRRAAIDILAVGGRYDELLESVAHLKVGNELFNKVDQDYAQSGVVGVSVAIEKIVTAASRSCTHVNSGAADMNASSMSVPRISAPVDVYVTSSGHSSTLQSRLRVLKVLWDSGLKAETTYDKNPSLSVQDIEHQLEERGVDHLVITNEKDKSTVTVKSFMHEQNCKIVETKIALDDLVTYLKRQPHVVDDVIANTARKPPTTAPLSDPQHPTQSANHVGTRQLSIEILPPDRLAFNTRKRYEYEIGTKLSNLPVVENISSKATMCAIAVDLPSSVMKSFACSLDISHGEESFHSSVNIITPASKYKKYISIISDKICEVKFTRKITLIMLYSYKDDGYFMLV